MPEQLILSPHRGSYRSDKFCVCQFCAALYVFITLCGLASISFANDANHCADMLSANALPADAKAVIEEPMLVVNGLQYCILGFETKQTTRKIVEHYRQRWTPLIAGTDGQNLVQLNAQHLMAKTPSSHYSLEITQEKKGRAVTVSRMHLAPASAEDKQPNPLTIPGFKTDYYQSNSAGRSLILSTDQTNPAAIDALINHFKAINWRIETREQLKVGNGLQANAVMTKQSQTLNITTSPNPSGTSAMLELLSPDYPHE